jgi:hypothetical protein
MANTTTPVNINELRKCITSGGDERLEIQKNGLNKYFVDPVAYEGVLTRGTCTCSPLNPDSFETVSKTFAQLKENPDSFFEIKRLQVERLYKFLNLDPTEFDIVFAPSGTDLCYYSLLFTKMLHPERPIMNLVTCTEELGTGSIYANQGRYHGQKTQILDQVTKGDLISLDLDIHYKSYRARNDEGRILDHRVELKKDIHQYKADYEVIGNLVIGSKSGIIDNLSIIKEAEHDMTWVVDLCQLRASTKLVEKLIHLNCLIMITGSKFYQSPPFSGAMIIPKTLSAKLKNVNVINTFGFENVFSRYDFPPGMENISKHFPNYRNEGLLLRWEAAISEMERLLNQVSEERIMEIITAWNKAIIDRISESEYFDLMEDQKRTNNSIISFRVKKNGAYFTFEQLKELHEHLTTHVPPYLKDFKKLIIGQPVSYVNHNFIRLALGSQNVRMLNDRNLDLSYDLRLLDFIEDCVKTIEFQ